MKICSPQLGISQLSSLGGEVYDYYSLKGFTERGVSVYIYLPRGREYDKTLKNFYVKQSIFKHIFPPLIFSFICLPYLFKTYKTEKFDVLRIHSPRYIGLAGIIFHIFYPKVPILISAVTPEPSKFLFFIEKLIYKISSTIIVQSHYMKMRLIKDFKIPKEKVEVTYGGISKKSEKKVKNFSIEEKIASTDKVLLFMGVMNDRKNPMFLIEVLKEIVKYEAKVKLVFIGNGDKVRDVKSLAIKYGLEQRVMFINKAYGIEKKYWFNRMDLFLMPSKDEGLGLALIEAMSFKKTVLASNIPPFLEIIKNGENGFSLPLKSKIWAKVVIDLLKNNYKRRKISSKARTTVLEKFDWEVMYDLNKKVISRV